MLSGSLSMVALSLLLAVGGGDCEPKKHLKKEELVSLQVTSTAFKPGEMIPAEYTCDGDDLSPPLAWESAPSGTKTLVLICDDPDAPMGTWDHWVVFNIPDTTVSLPEGVSKRKMLPAGSLEGVNSWGRNDYGGPCPPGGTHRYYFKLYALDCRLALSVAARKQDVETAMQGHILAQGQLMGKYKRGQDNRPAENR